MDESTWQSLADFKRAFRTFVDEMENVTAFYAVAAQRLRNADLASLAAMTGTEAGESFEVMLRAARLRTAALDKSLEMMSEALLIRARELTQ